MKRERIFSGPGSKLLWALIYEAKTVADLRRALYLVCCHLQNLESAIWPERKRGRKKRRA
jgi:hypothetical protein